MTTLDSLASGSEALVQEIGGSRPFQCRLMEMGLIPGTRVRLVRRNDVGGIVELRVRRSSVTLRMGEASHLTVSPL